MVTIRPMTPNDVDAVVPLELEVAKKSYRDDAVMPADHHADRIRSALDRRWDHLFVAISDGETGQPAGTVVGYAWLSVQRDRATDDRYGLLKSIAVDDAVQGGGVGRALLDRIEAKGRELSLSRVRLIVGADNENAIAFYEEAGYATRTRLMEKPLGSEAAGSGAPTAAGAPDEEE